MQSTTVVVFRALVMLACLVAIPLAALFGGSLPEMVKTLLQGHWPPGATAAAVAPSEAPRFEPTGSAQAMPSIPAAPPGAGLSLTALSWPGQLAGGVPSGVIPAAYEVSVPAPAAADPSRTNAAPHPSGASAPVGKIAAPRVLPPAATSGSRPKPLAPAAAAPGVDRFTYIQNRLQELGATRYMLELLGNQKVYRFYCKVAVGGNPNYTRFFEHIDTDPLEAMSDVLRQVEQWRAQRP